MAGGPLAGEGALAENTFAATTRPLRSPTSLTENSATAMPVVTSISKRRISVVRL